MKFEPEMVIYVSIILKVIDFLATVMILMHTKFNGDRPNTFELLTFKKFEISQTRKCLFSAKIILRFQILFMRYSPEVYANTTKKFR